MDYDKNRFIDNVYFLAREKHIKIKDLESSCGVSTGYFSRLRQGAKNISPGAELLLAVADRFSVSVDSLLSFDFSNATGSELEVFRYVEKLVRETETRKLAWQEDPGGYLDTQVFNTDGSLLHPLFINVIDENGMTRRSPDGTPIFYYHTMFHSNLFDLVPVKTYGCVFPGGRTLYLVRVWNTGDDPFSPGDWTELELVMTGPGICDPVPLCHTSHERAGRLDGLMNRLFAAVEDISVLPPLTPEAREIIRDYLQEGDGSHQE